jgi:hypothetical protein
MGRISAVVGFLALALAQEPAGVELIHYLDSIGQARLAERSGEIARLRSRADAERRKTAVREKILHLLGGLPERRGTVPVKEFGSVAGDGFRVEKIAYQSLPGFWVTANVYVPLAAGRFPAFLIVPGHGPTGKLGEYGWGANLARAGILAMAIDPLGQGERLQYYSPELKKSSIGGPTGEHGEANVAPRLIGDNVARYMINDSMRSGRCSRKGKPIAPWDRHEEYGWWRDRPGSRWLSNRPSSEIHLQPDLHNASVRRRGNRAEGRRTERAGRVAEVGVIEGVERFAAELDTDPFRRLKVFHQGQIDGGGSGSAAHGAAGGAEGVIRRL